MGELPFNRGPGGRLPAPMVGRRTRPGDPSSGGMNAMALAIQVTFDCADPARLAAFGAEARGYRLQ